MREDNYQEIGELTQLIRALQEGKKDKIQELIPLAIKEIRKIARRQLYKHNLDNDMTVTTLVHALYVKFGNYVNKHESFLEESSTPKREDFFSLCTTTIQHLIYDYCRKYKNISQAMDSLDDLTKDFSWLSSKETSPNIVLIVEEALSKFREQGHERQAKVIVFKYFGGFTDAEIGEILGIAIPTVQRDLRFAESKLFIILNPQIKDIYNQAISIQDKDQREKFIEEKCENDGRLKKAIKLLFK